MYVVTGALQNVGFQQLSVSNSAVTLTVPAGTTMAIISVETNAIRYRDDSTAPTSAIGMPVSAGQTLSYTGPFGQFKMIAQSGTATVDVNYYQGLH